MMLEGPLLEARAPFSDIDTWRPLTPEQQTFIASARELLLAQSCVRTSWSRADATTAVELFRSGVTLIELQRAIWLGCSRKYQQALDGGSLDPIGSLKYFQRLLEEMRREPLRSMGGDYWRYVQRKLKCFEQEWLTRSKGEA